MHDASEFARQERHPPSFNMTADGEGFVVEGTPVELARIKKGYQEALRHLEALVDDLLGDHDSSIPNDLVWADNMPRDTPGYGFLSLPASQELRMRGLNAKMSPDHRSQWFLPFEEGDLPEWNLGAVSSYMNKARIIYELSLVLLHFSQGVPARGTEITLLAYRNLPNVIRGFFMTNDGPLTILSYNKVSSLSFLMGSFVLLIVYLN